MDPLQEVHVPVGYAISRQQEMLREAQIEHLLRATSAKSDKVARRYWLVLIGLVPVIAVAVLFITQH